MTLCAVCAQSLSGHTSPVEAVRFGNAEEIVVAGSMSGALKIWDLEAAKSRSNTPHSPPHTHINTPIDLRVHYIIGSHSMLSSVKKIIVEALFFHNANKKVIIGTTIYASLAVLLESW